MTALMPETDLAVDPLSLVSAVDVPVPHVNLLPPEILERRALKRLARMLVGAVLATVAVGGVLGYEGGRGGAEAQASLDAATAQHTRLQTQVNGLAPAATALANAQATQKSLQAALANEVLWSTYLDQLKLKLPAGVRFSSIQVAPSTNSGGATSTGSAAVTLPRPVDGSANASGASGSADATAIASLTLNGMSESQDAVADLLQSLSTIPQFANVYLTSSTTSSGTTGSQIVNFVITADVTSSALSHRYDANGG